MLSSIILGYLTFVYFLSFLLYLLFMVNGKGVFGRMATAVTLLGLIVQTSAMILRWIESYHVGIGHAPLSNLYESLIFFPWAIALLYLVMEWRIKNRSIGVFVAPLVFLPLAYASFSPDIENRIQPLLPALQSNWLITPVLTCFFGYASFGISFGLSAMYLYKKSSISYKRGMFYELVPNIAALEELSYQTAVIGFLLLTLGIITGSVWANYAWGRYWGWDPKETWSLITWLVYATMLHSRLIRGWRGERMAIFSIIGFVCILVTWFGVNYLQGLHSYGKV